MRLSWNEIRARAGIFARQWLNAGYEKGETQSFYNDFFHIFGVRRESVAFPLPPKGEDWSVLDTLAQRVLDARANHPDATLADLYDPDLMPVNVRRAHQALDRAVDRLYRPRKFSSERERVEHLFTLYERMRAPLATAGKKKRRRRRVIRLSRSRRER